MPEESVLDADCRESLLALRERMKRVAGPQTAYDSLDYNSWYEKPEGWCPLTGHCFVCSQIVRELYGGTLMTGSVTRMGRLETHYWNRLPDGTEVDLTGSQYGGDGFTPVTIGIPSPLTGIRNPRLKRFRHLLSLSD